LELLELRMKRSYHSARKLLNLNSGKKEEECHPLIAYREGRGEVEGLFVRKNERMK